MICKHEDTTVVNRAAEGVAEEATICSACGYKLDARPLRPDAEGPTGTPEIEAQIQAEARAAKARRLAGLEEATSASRPPLPASRPAPVAPSGPSGPTGPTGSRGGMAVAVACGKHGGPLVPCNVDGAGTAPHCHHSAGGALGTFAGQCQCVACHTGAI